MSSGVTPAAGQAGALRGRQKRVKVSRGDKFEYGGGHAGYSQQRQPEAECIAWKSGTGTRPLEL